MAKWSAATWNGVNIAIINDYARQYLDSFPADHDFGAPGVPSLEQMFPEGPRLKMAWWVEDRRRKAAHEAAVRAADPNHRARGARVPKPESLPAPAPPVIVTHEAYIAGVRDLALARLPSSHKALPRLRAAKLVYGVGGEAGARGVTYYEAWQNGTTHDVVEVCARGEESDVQLAGTTIHELAHVLVGMGHGHNKAWKEACAELGLLNAVAAGMAYSPEVFEPGLWAQIAALPLPTDGRPVIRHDGPGSGSMAGLLAMLARPCRAGQGARGGKSRGKGSGSRLRLYVCRCEPDPSVGITNKARVASDSWAATCDRCGASFKRQESNA